MVNTINEELLEKAIEFVKSRGYENIKSRLDDSLDDPTSFSKDNSKSVSPDITATKRGSKSYFQLSIKNDDEQATVTKWKLFATLAEMKNGKLYLLAPRGHKSFTTNLVKLYNINAKVISI
ncbi:MAG: hypothetical protein EA409_07770 [Saprospirales bacterium]|jgi:hypothetical protein|nr:MAG: hypothetical protein EA409_07770 [Saprospirales bacterium]